jgi:hypothetical protein
MRDPLPDSADVREHSDDLLPLRTDFDVVVRGYDRRQVLGYVQSVEADNQLLSTDRDAAMAQAEELTRQLALARSEVGRLRSALDRVCRTPLDEASLSERLRRMVELADEDAQDIARQAQARIEQAWHTAEAAIGRLRERQQAKLDQLAVRQAAMEAEHSELMTTARARIEKMTREASVRRRELDASAEKQRNQARAELESTLAAARAAARQEQRAAQRELRHLHDVRVHISTRLRAARQEVAQALGIVDTDITTSAGADGGFPAPLPREPSPVSARVAD